MYLVIFLMGGPVPYIELFRVGPVKRNTLYVLRYRYIKGCIPPIPQIRHRPPTHIILIVARHLQVFSCTNLVNFLHQLTFNNTSSHCIITSYPSSSSASLFVITSIMLDIPPGRQKSSLKNLKKTEYQVLIMPMNPKTPSVLARNPQYLKNPESWMIPTPTFPQSTICSI